jgi:hypothetical protein
MNRDGTNAIFGVNLRFCFFLMNDLARKFDQPRFGARGPRLLATFCAAMFIWGALTNPANVSSSQTTSHQDVQIELGFGGQIKLGFWQPFWITTPGRTEPFTFEITVLDGDETPITYRGPLHALNGELNRYQGYLKLGKGFGTVSLRLFDRDRTEVGSHSLSLRQNQKTRILSPTDSLVLTIEPNESIAAALASTHIADRSRGTVLRLVNASQLPRDWFCYEGVETVFLNISNLPWLETVSPSQWTALELWIENGGQLILSLDPNEQNLLAADGPLERFVSGEIAGKMAWGNSKSLDAFVGSAPLIATGSAALSLIRIENPQGMAAVEYDGHPLVLRTAKGFGEIVLTTFDLNDSHVTQWGGFKNLVYRLKHRIPIQEAVQSQRITARGSSVTHPGFDDLIGQLRVPLDQFSKVSFLSFNWIAVLIGLYILCIGPGDYFLLRRLTGKMELTWITFPLISLFFCGLAIWLAHRTRAAEIQINQLELIDLDAESGRVRGTVWSNLYSPRAGDYQIALNRTNRLKMEIESDLIGWQGLPGKGYGGMQTQSGAAIMRSPYLHARENVPSNQIGGFSRLENMPLYVSSTKPLLTQYQGHFSGRVQSNLRLRSRNARLEGTLVNPFPFRLKNCRLLFENHAYELSNSLEVGEAIAVEAEMRERTLVGYLTRRRTVADEAAKSTNTQNLPWDVNETRISRIADMLMFYSAAGGSNYTAGLSHNYQQFVDMSEHLNLGRAILVGEIDGLGTSLTLDGQTVESHYDQVVTIIRVVLPVTYLEKKR